MATRTGGVGKEKKRPSRRRQDPYNLRSHQAKLCDTLDNALDVTLQSLAVGLYSKGIIDAHTKAEVLRYPGYKGAAMLMGCLELHVQRDPEVGESVLDIMDKHDCLRDIVKKMRAESSQLSASQSDDENNSSGKSYRRLWERAGIIDIRSSI